MKLSIEQAITDAKAAYKKGVMQDVERICRGILEFDPSHPDANILMGELAVAVNKHEEAIQFFRTAFKATPTGEEFWLTYAHTLIKQKLFEEASIAIGRAREIGIHGDDLNSLAAQIERQEELEATVSTAPRDHITILVDHYQNQRFDEAETLATEMIVKFSKDSLVWQILGAVLGAKGRWPEALHANQKAVEFSPEDARAHVNLGVTLQELGKLGQAEISYKRAIALFPNSAVAHNNLGNTLRDQKKLLEAEASFRNAVALNPNYALAYSNLGNTLNELGKLEEAESSYNKAITLQPDSAAAYNNLGVTLQNLGRSDEALASYSQALTLRPDYAEAHNNLGNTLKELGKLEEAEESYNNAINYKPDYAQAHSNLGATLRSLRRLEEAEASCKAALVLRPNFLEAHKNLSQILLSQGRHKEGITESIKGSGKICFSLRNGLSIS